MNKVLGIFVAAAVLLLAAAPADAGPVAVELGLVIDGSGSIGSTNFNAQKTAYANALQNVFNADPGLFGQVAIGVWQFSTGAALEVATVEIVNQTALTGLKNGILGMTYQFGGSTNIGNAIQTSANYILGNADGIVGTRMVIDVSTDGFHNSGLDPVTASTAAIAGGIDQINGLGINRGDPAPGWVMGVGSFWVPNVTFGTLQDALETKLRRELIPEPASIALLGIGLVAFGARRRRRKAA